MDYWAWGNQIVSAMVYYAIMIAVIVPLTRRWQSPNLIIAMYIGSYVISQYTSPRLTLFGPWIVPGGNISFVATVALMDLLVVYWGLALARQVIVSGFLVQLLLYVANLLVLQTPRPFEELQSIEQVYSLSARIAIASPIAYLVAENVNALLTWLYRRVWWARALYSDPIALAVDTLIFVPIAFYGEVPTDVLVEMIVGLTLLKIAFIPFNLLAIYVARRFMGFEQGR